MSQLTPNRRRSPSHRRVVIGDCDLHLGECEEVLSLVSQVDSIVTDPPYGLRFMGKSWDYDVPTAETWKQCLSTLRPGGHLLATFSSRTYHRGVVQIEDAGFEIRDQLMWIYGSGFPKSLDISKALDKAAGVKRAIIGRRTDRAAMPKRDIRCGRYVGSFSNIDLSAITAPATDAARQWEGWGTALKPAHEPIVLARKPLIGTAIENVLASGTGALNIDACRVPIEETLPTYTPSKSGLGRNGIYGISSRQQGADSPSRYQEKGRWPANVIHDGSPDVIALFPETKRPGNCTGDEPSDRTKNVFGNYRRNPWTSHGDAGSAARFFYCAKASRRDRDEGLNPATSRNRHPTVKPTLLMQYLCRLVTPSKGIVLDPFMGSGSTGKAAVSQGFRFIGIERDVEYFEIACRRIQAAYDDNGT